MVSKPESETSLGERAHNKEGKEEGLALPALEYHGHVFHGTEHGDATNKLLDKFPEANLEEARTGWVTTAGRFVDMEEARRIGNTTRQIKGMFPEGPHLDSADVHFWPLQK